MFDFAANMPAFGPLSGLPAQSGSDSNSRNAVNFGGAKVPNSSRNLAGLGKIANYSDRAPNQAKKPTPRTSPAGNTANLIGAPSRAPVAPTGAPELRPKPETARARRAELWRLKERGRNLMPLRTQKCMRMRVQDHVEVAVYQDAKGNQAACYRGLVTCANGNACPICAQRIRTARALELAEQLEGWRAHRASVLGIVAKKAKDTLSLLTLTCRHSFDHRFEPMLKGLQHAQSRFWDRINRATKKNGGKSLAEIWGLAGYVRATETTAGDNGWHPHAHILLFWDRPHRGSELLELRKLMASIWRECVRKYLGREHEPSMEHGLDLRCGSNAARYVQKLAFELADPVTKRGRSKHLGGPKGRTPFQILGDAIEGDEKSASLFREFWKGANGARIVAYSRRNGLKELLLDLAGQTAEQSDQEIMKGDRGVTEFIITDNTWDNLKRIDGGPVKLLEMVESRGAAGAEAWLRREKILARSAAEVEQSRQEILSWLS